MKKNDKNKNKPSSIQSYFIISLGCTILLGGLIGINQSIGLDEAIARENSVTSRGSSNIIAAGDNIFKEENLRNTDDGGNRSSEQSETIDREEDSGGGDENRRDNGSREGRIQLIQRTGLVVGVTTYNPEVGQTDSSPCKSSLGIDICEQRRMGVNVIALSQDLLEGKGKFYCKENCFARYGDTVRVTATDCDNSKPYTYSKDYVILDTMHEDNFNSVDIFYLDTATDNKCHGTIELIKRYAGN